MEVAYSSHLFAGGLDQFADSGTIATVAFAGFGLFLCNAYPWPPSTQVNNRLGNGKYVALAEGCRGENEKRCAGIVCEPRLFENAPWVLGPCGALDPCLVRYPFGISGEVGIGNVASVKPGRNKWRTFFDSLGDGLPIGHIITCEDVIPLAQEEPEIGETLALRGNSHQLLG